MQPSEARPSATSAMSGARTERRSRAQESSGSSNPLPAISLPTGGGAIRGMGEKFTANPVTGTGSLSVPIFASPGRSGFGPQLSLSYDSGASNGPFGLGWSLALPSITRKTDKGLPQYADAKESDTFILSGAEDLVPLLVLNNGNWERKVSSRTLFGQHYRIHYYCPRTEGLFARIERWINQSDSTDTFWRSISTNNVTAWYGKTAESRIADPSNPSHAFTWLLCETYDDKGNLCVYQYKAEDSTGVNLAQAHERNRSGVTRSANRHLKRVLYGNRAPYFPKLTADQPIPHPTDWCFELVFDYGEHDESAPVPQESGTPWDCRPDPFSTYRARFEIRTYRLCRRALMFHHFADDTATGLNCLVRSTDLTHSQTSHPPADPTKPFYSVLLSVQQTGYTRNDSGGYNKKSLPPVEFEYTEAVINETVQELDPESIRNVPSGLDGTHYRWVDLEGVGLSGILTEQGDSWFYNPNLSPANQVTDNGVTATQAQFGGVALVASLPSLATLASGRQQFMDLSGNGHLDLVQFDGPSPGLFERTSDEGWQFTAFEHLPALDWLDPNLKFIDLTGDGHADLLISEDNAFWWHDSLAAAGFGAAQRVPQSFDEEKGPKLVFADGTETIVLADLSGDGLTDLMRIRNGEICYWPNLGYGRFGAKVTMDNAPWFEAQDLFDGRRIRLADIDGSGTADVVYFAGGRVHLYFNQSGNAWGERRALQQFPRVESLSSASVIDLLGNGTACLVWSSPLPGNALRPMRYVDLMGAQKPHLLVRSTNNLGAETRVQYAPSTKFYVADKLAGTPWLTRIPFPVHVVERVETYDFISRNRFVTRYAYHHGYYDGVEREFRGFGRVDQMDTEEFGALADDGAFPQATNIDAASNVPPVVTKTWFHTGLFFGRRRVSKQFEKEYYHEGDTSDGIAGLTQDQQEAMLLPDTVLPTSVLFPDSTRLAYTMTGEETREACRALRGSILRQEVYALDGTDASDHPYSVSEANYTIEIYQPQGPNQYAVFLSHARESIDFHYERKLFQVTGDTLAGAGATNARNAADPRVTHAFTLAVDTYGNVLQSAAVGYGRRYLDPALNAADQARQSATLCTYSQASFTNAVLDDDVYRTPLAAEGSSYELLQVQPDGTQPGVTNLYNFDEIASKVRAATDGAHDIAYENLTPTGLNPGHSYRQLLKRTRAFYRPDDMGASAGDAKALLPLGSLEPLALHGDSYKLSFTPGLLSDVYQRAATDLLPDPAAVMSSTAPDGGGYVDLDGNGNWWTPSGRIYFLPAQASPQDEKTEALRHFFLPRRVEDPFGNAATVDYDDPHDLFAIRTTDPLLNTATAVNDYRVLQPSLLTDANGNRGAVCFDILGLVAGTAVMGKSTETLGDLLNGFTPDLTQEQIDDFYAADDPHTLAGALLGTATTRIVYDLDRFQNSRAAAPSDPTQWQPAFAASLVRETHVSDLTENQQTKIQVAFSYSDGYGREIQKKVQAEPAADTPAIPRWVASGWTIFNNKGKPVRQYEPFFSQLPRGHQYEFGVAVGVSPILCYDPLTRVVATIHPNHTYEKVVFDPWHQDTWDVNDTVLQTDPTMDPDAGDVFTRLPVDDYSPTWYSQRSSGELGALEQAAANKAAAHANTPGTAYFDTLGRPFLTVADNAADGKFETRVALDIEGNQRSVTDALGRKVMTYDYDMLGNHIHQASMEAAERWMLSDVAGKPIRAWDTRGHNFRTTYDALRRPTGAMVQGTDAANSDPRTLGAPNWILYEKSVYGEGQPNAATDMSFNLRGRVYQHFDGAGVVTNFGLNLATNHSEAYDFKGNLLRGIRQFHPDYKGLPDWSTAQPPFPESFASSTQYDALNRPIVSTSPDGSVFRPTYNEANLLETVNVNLQGSPTVTPFVTNIDYDVKGQRTRIEYFNGVLTAYEHDPVTFRLIRLNTTRPGFPAVEQNIQDLKYTYDPVGNITHIQDDAQDTIFFNNQRVEPSNDYTYDAIYRLIGASGREHLGQSSGGAVLAPTATSYNDSPRVRLLQPGDGNAMGIYTEQYQYDKAGNFLQYIHKGSDSANPGWTRSYIYDEQSLLEPGVSNRLTQTQVKGAQPYNEDYVHDLHGNMIRMPQLQLMQWDFKDQLTATQRQAVNPDDTDGTQHQGERTYYVYDSTGQRTRKGTERQNGTLMKERLYLGGYEVYREYDASGGTVTLERDTLHVMEDEQRIALVETRTQGDDGAVQLIRYQLSNHLGSASLELDVLAQIISYEEYFPYGATSYEAGRTAAEVSLKRYRYTGMERDEETGLNYHGARHYAAWLGRWLSCDPGFAKAIASTSSSLYAGLSLNPMRWVDRDGRAPEWPSSFWTRVGQKNWARPLLIMFGLIVKDPEGEAAPEPAIPEDVQKGIDDAQTPTPDPVIGDPPSPPDKQFATIKDFVDLHHAGKAKAVQTIKSEPPPPPGTRIAGSKDLVDLHHAGKAEAVQTIKPEPLPPPGTQIAVRKNFIDLHHAGKAEAVQMIKPEPPPLGSGGGEGPPPGGAGGGSGPTNVEIIGSALLTGLAFVTVGYSLSRAKTPTEALGVVSSTTNSALGMQIGGMLGACFGPIGEAAGMAFGAEAPEIARDPEGFVRGTMDCLSAGECGEWAYQLTRPVGWAEVSKLAKSR